MTMLPSIWSSARTLRLTSALTQPLVSRGSAIRATSGSGRRMARCIGAGTVAPRHRAAERRREQMRIRRVVTGQADGGKSVFVSDEWVEPTTIQLLPGAEF